MLISSAACALFLPSVGALVMSGVDGFQVENILFRIFRNELGLIKVRHYAASKSHESCP